MKVFAGNNSISYVYMGNLLGARYSNSELFFNDKEMVDFKKVRETIGFRHGIDKLVTGINRGLKLCLMCSEKDPFDCHRFVLVSYALAKKGIEIKHILANGNIITNNELEERLLVKYEIEYGHVMLFDTAKTREEVIDEGYEKRNYDIGYIGIPNVLSMS
ncbi:protein containing DUF488 [Candidatus Omnitrophus magneticus]|uniref:Protein containing DUF488 n=1 Tax=Candidatus Omnitrophus magneticus TaxID=1609969 RepID=A0A0F0CNS9_9BACT|nr:protein containing DUF488 [Candidatus Omnitrophus magneticus]